jgi:ABC-2 type transport system permease protein
VAEFNPMMHFIMLMRNVMLKGAGFTDVVRQLAVLATAGVVVLTFAVRQYHKRAG